MAFDSLVTNPGRLRILTALVAEPQQDFVHLRSRTQLTDGNLSTHAKRLSTAGMIEIHKSIREGKPVTHFKLTPLGRQSLEDHARSLLAALNATEQIALPAEGIVRSSPVDAQPFVESINITQSSDDADWVD